MIQVPKRGAERGRRRRGWVRTGVTESPSTKQPPDKWVGLPQARRARCAFGSVPSLFPARIFVLDRREASRCSEVGVRNVLKRSQVVPAACKKTSRGRPARSTIGRIACSREEVPRQLAKLVDMQLDSCCRRACKADQMRKACSDPFRDRKPSLGTGLCHPDLYSQEPGHNSAALLPLFIRPLQLCLLLLPLETRRAKDEDPLV